MTASFAFPSPSHMPRTYGGTARFCSGSVRACAKGTECVLVSCFPEWCFRDCLSSSVVNGKKVKVLSCGRPSFLLMRDRSAQVSVLQGCSFPTTMQEPSSNSTRSTGSLLPWEILLTEQGCPRSSKTTWPGPICARSIQPSGIGIGVVSSSDTQHAEPPTLGLKMRVFLEYSESCLHRQSLCEYFLLSNSFLLRR